MRKWTDLVLSIRLCFQPLTKTKFWYIVQQECTCNLAIRDFSPILQPRSSARQASETWNGRSSLPRLSADVQDKMLCPAAPGGPTLPQLFTRNSVHFFCPLMLSRLHPHTSAETGAPVFPQFLYLKELFQMTAEEKRLIMGSKNLVGSNSNVKLLIKYAKFLQKQQGIGKKKQENKTKCCIYCKQVWTQRINISTFQTGIWLSNLLSTNFRFASF